ncbi:ac124 [Catopsilia pomona nucleopolyhedrovirus]|uniref:Ac124 n=1 Tax=Catopsilia pomona nucleopolyhedrovirus TaxID=1850906 RepID=A0A172WZA4_9ABAC|nr:ac124 [Catopsilia pomona nucleopolyhedrovirus]ANF29675.1 ac124 [Catopsilia pomona nucleopolyhedrovirus]
MGIFSRFHAKYEKLNGGTATKLPFAALSYINVTVCVFSIMLIGYMATLADDASLKYLQYWLLLSCLLNVVFNVPSIWWPKKNEADEIVYELKLFLSLYVSNIVINFAVFLNNSVNFVFLNNLIHYCVTLIMFIELLTLLGHTMGAYADYRYTKSCYIIILFVGTMTFVTVVGLDALKLQQFNSFTFGVFACAVYIIVAAFWSLKYNGLNGNSRGHYMANVCNVRIVPILNNDHNNIDNEPPPSFSTVEMEDMLKNKK